MECAYSESLEPIANGNGWGCGADAGGFLTCSTLASTCCKGAPEAQCGTQTTVATKSNSLKEDLRCTMLTPSYHTSRVAWARSHQRIRYRAQEVAVNRKPSG